MLFHQNGHFSATFFSSKGKRRFLALWEERFKTVKSGFMGTSSTAPRSNLLANNFPSGEGFLYHRACGITPERSYGDNEGREDSRHGTGVVTDIVPYPSG